MNITNTALKLYLTDLLPLDLTKYFTKDYAQIVLKVESFKKKNNQTPSLDFLIQYASKLGEDKEQSGRIEDILYVVSKIKDVGMSVEEVGELFLSEYKSDKIRDLIKKSSTAIIEENMVLVEKLSKEIAEISSLNLSNKNYLENDIKKDFNLISKKLEYVPTGMFSDMNYNFSKLPIGSLITVLGKSGTGKSTLLLEAMLKNYLSGRNVVNFNYELQRGVLYSRLTAALTGVTMEEITTHTFLTQEASDLVFLSSFVFTYEITLEQANKELTKHKDRDSFEEYIKSKYEVRKNKMKIVAAEDASALQLAKTKNMKLDELPNDVELFQLLEEYGEDMDDVYVDLISEISFVDGYLGRELCLTNFAKQIKSEAMKHSFNVYLASQVENTKTFDGNCTPKYSKAIYGTSDVVLTLISTNELNKENMVALLASKNRHNRHDSALILNKKFECMQFINTYQEVSVYEVEDEFNKENRKKEK